MRLVEQLFEHRVDQNFAASFEALPFDLLGTSRIVKFKGVEDVLEIDLSLTSACWTKVSESSLRRMPDHSPPSQKHS
jgi:hypothetical protein